MRTFVGGIDSSESRNHSIGVLVSERLAHDAPIEAAQVVVEELSSNPIAVAERLQREWPPFERVIFVSAIARARPAGTVAAYRWDGEVAAGDASDLSMSNSQSSLEHTLLVARQLGGLPDETIIVEVEPDALENGELSPAESAAVERARTLVRRLATNRRAAAGLPVSALGASYSIKRD